MSQHSADTVADQPAPTLQAPEIERTVIAVALRHPDLVDLAGLTPADFCVYGNQLIWQAMLGARAAGAGIHPRTIAAELEGDPEFTAAGGAQQYLVETVEYFGDVLPSAFADHAAAVKRFAIRRKVMALGAAISADAATMPLTETADELIGRAVAALMDVDTDASRRSGRIGPAAHEAYERAFNPSLAQRDAVPFGLGNLDARTAGMNPGELIIVAASTGAGKSTFCNHTMKTACRMGLGVMSFQMEMTRRAQAQRLMADLARERGQMVLYNWFRKGSVHPSLKPLLADLATEMGTWPLEVDERPNVTIAEIASRARMQKKAFQRQGVKMGLVTVDYLGLIQPSGNYRGNKVAETSEVSKGLKNLAKELEVPVVALVQLNREAQKREDNRPKMYDLRDSGSIENDADIILLLYREAYFLQQKEAILDPLTFRARMDECRHRLEINTAKMREGEAGIDIVDVDVGTASIRDEGTFS